MQRISGVQHNWRDWRRRFGAEFLAHMQKYTAAVNALPLRIQEIGEYSSEDSVQGSGPWCEWEIKLCYSSHWDMKKMCIFELAGLLQKYVLLNTIIIRIFNLECIWNYERHISFLSSRWYVCFNMYKYKRK